ELAGGGLHARPGGEAATEDAQRVLAGVEGERFLEQAGCVDGARALAVWVQAEEGAHADPQRQATRPDVEIDCGAGRELLERGARLLADHLDRRRESLAVEG